MLTLIIKKNSKYANETSMCTHFVFCTNSLHLVHCKHSKWFVLKEILHRNSVYFKKHFINVISELEETLSGTLKLQKLTRAISNTWFGIMFRKCGIFILLMLEENIRLHLNWYYSMKLFSGKYSSLSKLFTNLDLNMK